MTQHKAQAKRSRPRYLNGSKLRDARLACGKTQAEVAAETGTTQSEVSQWERGIYGCHRLMIGVLARAVGCTPETLTLGTATGRPGTAGGAEAEKAA